MPRQSLEDLLDQLHKELEGAESLPADAVQRLRTLREDIQTVLAGGEEGLSAEAEGLGSQLGDAVSEFEDSHPSLTLSMRRVIQAFRSLGFS